MRTRIFYFSATGNCMTTAKILAELLPETCEVVSVSALRQVENVMVEEDNVGFVFPVYYGDMPYIVRETIEKMTFTHDPYIFLMATYRGHPGDVAKRLEDVLAPRGVHLALSVGIPMPGNSYLSTEEEMQNALVHQKDHIQALVGRIISRETEDYTQPPRPEASMVSHLHNFRGIQADDRCIGCGICANICPLDNIRIVDGHARIGERCMTCLTCFHWCPQEAIYMSKEEKIARRSKYHHPDVRLQDILNEKKQAG